MSKSTEVAVQSEGRSGSAVSLFSSRDAFDEGWRIARALASSALVPTAYKGEENVPNVLIAMDMANRMRISPIMVMQNLHVIEGRPSWGSVFIIGAINACGLFSPLRFEVTDHGEQNVSYETWGANKGERVTKSLKVRNMECRASAIEKATGEVLRGPPVTIAMAVAEGWYSRKGSKWLTMPETMLQYRAAAFFGRLYAPHLLNGMPMAEEVVEIETEYRELPRAEPAPSDEATSSPAPKGRTRGVGAALKRAAEAEVQDAEVEETDPEKGKAPAEAEKRERRAPDQRSGEARRDRERGKEAEELASERRSQDERAGERDNGDPGNQGDRDLPFGEPGEDEDDDNYQPA